jgi:4-diphosphocytidyl-2-C-methyl-D-erythritol kinase
MITRQAPAKINLTLEVQGKRADGYHEIRSVIQTISLCDVLHFLPGKTIEFRSRTVGWLPEMSLISRAAMMLKEETGHDGGAIIDVEKYIPLMAGLGGDSSDAAAVLLGLTELWDLKWSRAKLQKLALKLGSDVSYFLSGGTALMEGRGETITALPTLPKQWVVLVNPAIPRQPGKTAQAYASLKPEHFTDGNITKILVEDLKAGRAFSPSRLFNTFENVAFTKGSKLITYREHLLKSGAPHVHLAGSGPALFVLVEDENQGRELFTKVKKQGMEVYPASTGGCIM